MLSKRELFHALFAGASRAWAIYYPVAAVVAHHRIVAVHQLSKASGFDAVGTTCFVHSDPPNTKNEAPIADRGRAGDAELNVRID
jgi:hypothetical protein